MKHSREKNVDHNSQGFSFSFFGTEWFSFSQEEEKVKNLSSTPSENVFWGETKKTFFFPWKNIFVLIKVKRFSLENFFLLYETNWINIFFRRIFCFSCLNESKKKGKSCDIFFQDFLMFKTKFFSSALHFTHRNKILLKKIFNLRTYTFF